MCNPLFFNTALMRYGRERHEFFTISDEKFFFLNHNSFMACFKWFSELELRVATFFFKMTQQFAMWLISGEFAAKGPRILI